MVPRSSFHCTPTRFNARISLPINLVASLGAGCHFGFRIHFIFLLAVSLGFAFTFNRFGSVLFCTGPSLLISRKYFDLLYNWLKSNSPFRFVVCPFIIVLPRLRASNEAASQL